MLNTIPVLFDTLNFFLPGGGLDCEKKLTMCDCGIEFF